ncbi:MULTISPECIES: glycosyltransferase [unclassified Curtobacterium]|uniref:glycosyltransferase n=1 Tax=unclassified Curtobacterium TaxID=257496 RepID=UPI000D9EB80E|nr:MULTISPECIES: glycosyltransferase [unclassified Curtobacterium]PYY65195.1 glycosyltransferase [Curtobacterium sp. MCPF17_003]PZF33551.1 glycosyltransferase [Curtobacterium sp. MCPF17_051]WIB71937.1 glycosyltransferase [Curtobacterium sp. MCBD17_026]
MRILFSGVPALGHLLPLVPLARAAQAAGHDVALLTSGGMREPMSTELPTVPVLAAGPMPPDLFAEVARRIPGSDPANRPEPAAVAEFFAGTRVDLTVDDALRAARGWEPDVVVADAVDLVGPLVAAELGVPYAIVAFGPEVPEEFRRPMAELVLPRYEQRGVVPTPPVALLDPTPVSLQAPGWTQPPVTIPFRSEPHSRPDVAAEQPLAPFPASEWRPRVLVTLGTVFGDATLLTAILDGFHPDEVDVVATVGVIGERLDDTEHVHFLPFRPMRELLEGVDLVVAAAGAGTVLAAASVGVPMVLLPQGADQFINATRAAEAGVAVVVDEPSAVGPAVHRMLAERSHFAAARRLGEETAQRPSATDAVRELVDRVERIA